MKIRLLLLPLVCFCLLIQPIKAVAKNAEPVTTDADLLKLLDLDAPGMEAVKDAAAKNDLTKVKQAYLDYRRGKSQAVWRRVPENMQVNPSSEDDAGNDIMRHYIRNWFYSFDPKAANMGKDFDWTYNPIPANDPAFTNEWTWCAISRTQFWKKLADAYLETHNEKYAAEWVAELHDFAKKNPANHDGENGRVQLWRTLDCAIRMTDAWPYAYYRFYRSPSFTSDDLWLYLKLINDHTTVLKKGLQDSKRTGNWVTTESSALFTIGALFPELKTSTDLRQFAIDRLVKELNRAVPPDGFEAELTPNYHMVVMGSLLEPMKLAQLNQITLPEIFTSKVISMWRALITVMDQNGKIVPTNDSPILDIFEIAKKALKYTNDPLIQWAASGAKGPSPLPASTMLPYAGFYTMRGGWNPDDTFLFFRAGPTGIGHEHEDMLEIVLKAWGKTLLFEPGTYTYDHSDWRRFTVGTASHSTVIIDGKWQHRGPSDISVMEPVHNPWVTTPIFDFVSATYDKGYQQSVYDPKKQYSPQDWIGPLDTSVSHTRRVLFLKPDYFLVLDTLDGTGRHTFDAHFHLDAPSAHVDASGTVSSNNAGDVQVRLFPLEKDHLTTEIIQGQKKPLLGWFPEQHRAIPTVRFRKQQDAPAIFATFLYPYKGDVPLFEEESLAVAGRNLWTRKLTTYKEKTEIVIAKDNTATAFSYTSAMLGEVSVRASGLLVRHFAESDRTLSAIWGATSYADVSTSFSVATPATLLLSKWRDHTFIYNAENALVAVSFAMPPANSIVLSPSVWTDVTRTSEFAGRSH